MRSVADSNCHCTSLRICSDFHYLPQISPLIFYSVNRNIFVCDTDQSIFYSTFPSMLILYYKPSLRAWLPNDILICTILTPYLYVDLFVNIVYWYTMICMQALSCNVTGFIMLEQCMHRRETSRENIDSYYIVSV